MRSIPMTFNSAITKTLVFFIVLSNSFSLCYGNNPGPTDPPAKRTVYITLKLQSGSKVKINTAPLKYNKHLAYSFTVDDGYHSAFLSAFPLLNGGQISPPFPDEWNNDQGGDGSYSPGLFFTDGCGQKIPFKLALAINAGAIGDQPLNRGHLSWPEVKKMYESGWDIINHGLNHATKHNTNFLYEVTENIKAVKEQLGFTMSQFAVPGGESDPGYEHEYEKDAFLNGSFAVSSYKGMGPIIKVDKKVSLCNMIYTRNFIQSKTDSADFPDVDQRLAKLDSIIKQPEPIWYNEYSHGVGNSNLWFLSMVFPEFKYYMTHISEKYGQNGNDTLWMAPFQEVYEYIWLRDRIRISYEQKGQQVVIKMDLPEIPASFRYSEISLAIENAAAFSVTASSPSIKVQDNGKKSHNLLNVVL